MVSRVIDDLDQFDNVRMRYLFHDCYLPLKLISDVFRTLSGVHCFHFPEFFLILFINYFHCVNLAIILITYFPDLTLITFTQQILLVILLQYIIINLTNLF